ncbi:MAG: SDR family oxidoreductase [Balneolaceae bacterium]|nr:SDR family oxidoreductase [Balneolaceae bacterium]
MIISVLGCGWLGFPLAERLLTHEHTVKGSTTTPKKVGLLKQSGIDAYHLNLPDSFSEKKTEPFWDCDVLVLNIPPGRRNPNVKEEFPALVKKIVEKAKEHTISWIVFTSSTSVYPKFGGLTTEEDAKPGEAARKSGEALLKAEEVIINSGIDYTILRLAGLYGYDRHPVKHLSGKKNLSDALKPVNLVHQLDCVNIITQIIEQKKRNEIYNVVSDGHPPRKEFYQCAAKHFNLPPPTFDEDTNSNYRIVSNEKIKGDLFYEFFYPNPMDHTH